MWVVGRRVAHQQTILQHQLGVPQLSPILTLLRGSVRCHRLRAPSHTTAPAFRPQPQVQTVPCFGPAGCREEAPTTLTLGLMNLLEQLTEVRNMD